MIAIEELWARKDFKPNPEQRDAILHTEGPLFLMAGPGSGKTRVLLWRTLNLIVYHGVKPEEIFLSTFTEKAAAQLKDGLRRLLGIVTNETGQPYDLAKMSIGTVHSICQKILDDRRFSEGNKRNVPPVLLDELGQYFKVQNRRFWTDLCLAAGFEDAETGTKVVNEFFGNVSQEYGPSTSRHRAVMSAIALFNRFSEESLDPDNCATDDEGLQKILAMYRAYLAALNQNPLASQVDFSLLQKRAYGQIVSTPKSALVFKHIIIDEYQDTNAIQEKIFFALAQGYKNICVVGDDDQALYRFRGATVENLVEFSAKCETALGVKPRPITLNTNYRSRKDIVKAYTEFIELCDWQKPEGGYYRIHDKNIRPAKDDSKVSVIVSTHTFAHDVYREIIELVYRLKKEKRIDDYSQVAFLFASLKKKEVQGFIDAITAVNEEKHLAGTDDEIKIQTRNGQLLDTDEARAVWGLFMLIFDRPHGPAFGREGQGFKDWMIKSMQFAEELCQKDKQLAQYIEDRKAEVAVVVNDYKILSAFAETKGYDAAQDFTYSMIRDFAEAKGLSQRARRNLTNKYFTGLLERAEKEGRHYKISYIINRAASLDWSVLDLFYQLNGFAYFREKYALAQRQTGVDEGPICTLGAISRYLSRFMDEYAAVITGSWLSDSKFVHSFLSSFTFALYRRGEAEEENVDEPFPKGRIPFMTIHGSKGLEFPVVVLGSLDENKGVGGSFEKDKIMKETIIRGLLNKDGEPLDKISKFDNMRMFYVALSRAANLLVLPRYATTTKNIPQPHQIKGTDEFKAFFANNDLVSIPDYDTSDFERTPYRKEDLGKTYSYNGDYVNYVHCPRQYMIFKKYNFAPSRGQMMMFGSLVHRTIEDLHYFLINRRAG
jgi:DNA helicase-2/ATP-dependent DNA helicase PcrA